MKHYNYTRQRQGRDFTAHKDDTEKNKSLLEQLELSIREAERNAVPIDGFEAPEMIGR